LRFKGLERERDILRVRIKELERDRDNSAFHGIKNAAKRIFQVPPHVQNVVSECVALKKRKRSWSEIAAHVAKVARRRAVIADK
jgi:hypothetical protein